MNLSRRRFLHLAAGASALSAVSRFARGQAYPTRPIRLVIPFPPGGAFDAVGRPWADRIKSLLGTVVVENNGGGGGSLGAAAVARARPDGYTLMLGGTITHVNEALLKSRPLYDPVKDLDPIATVAAAGMTGQVIEFHRSGKMRVLAVTGATRLATAPELPTAAESGFPGMTVTGSIGLLAPTGSPIGIVEQIAQATRTAVAEPAFKQMLIDAGIEPALDSNPEKFRRSLAADVALWTPVVKALGLKID